jgi:RHS repeat-associated protein
MNKVRFMSATDLVIILFCCTKIAAQNPNPTPSVYPSNIIINSIRSWTASRPITNEADIYSSARTIQDVKQLTQYVDGFGRPLQTVAKQASPLGNDMVSANTYDSWGREVYRYSPFTSNVATSGDVINDGNVKTDPFQEQVSFYNTYLSGQVNETNVGSGNNNWAYSLTNYELSPLNRILNTYAPGVNWVGNPNPVSTAPPDIQHSFELNTSPSPANNDQVYIWNIGAWTITVPEQNIIPTTTATYGAGMLTKTVSVDEEGHQLIQYKDLYGQLILTKSQIGSTPDNGSGSTYNGWICTYFVYDDHRNLRFVITPDLVSQMYASNSWVISQTQADQLCYRYEYDQLNRMVIKKTPGTPTGSAGEVWMVYDQRNRLVMKQDGNMRSPSVKKWQYIQYDNLDRPIAEGFITDPIYYTTLSYHLTNASASSNNSAGVSAWPILANYTSEVTSQVFYDNYSKIPASLPNTTDVTTNGTGNTTYFTTTYNTSPTFAQPITQSQMTQGMITGTNVEVLGLGGVAGTQYIPTVNFYDEKGRIIQIQKINYTTGKDITTSQYSWDGKVLSSLISHKYVSASNPQTHLLSTAITYDATGRMKSISKTINSTVNGIALTAPSTNPATIVSYTYDEMGKLSGKNLGASLETQSLGYNVRGWLLNINQAYINGSSSSNYFGLELGYDKHNSLAPNNSYITPIFNGNISGTTWKSKGDGINRKYDLNYDNTNRLLSAPYLQNSSGTSWDNGFIDFSVSGLSYDANGNILTLNQNGFAQSGKLPIDQLSYNYVNGNGNSNQLNYVNDGANVANSTLGDFHFAGGPKTGSSVDYSYDADGNTTGDNNRAISTITYYSYPNLPQTITTAKGTITYTYDGLGSKIKKTVVENNVTIPSILVNNVIVTNITTNITTTTTYINGFVYKSVSYSNSSLSPLNTTNTDVLQYLGTEEGRLRFKPAIGAVAMSFVHDYFERDHLGNVRVSITDEVQQDIYPAATGETTSQLVGGASNTAQNYEALYYSFSPSDFVPTSSLGSWYTNMVASSQILNENGGGIPVNNDPYSYTSSPSQQVFQVGGNTANNPSGHNFGLGITLKVMAGDNINILGVGFWHNIGNLPGGQYPVSAVLASLLGSFGGSAAVTSTFSHSALDGSAFNSSATGPTGSLVSPLLNNTPIQSGTQAPYAGINYIIFDDQFRPVVVGFLPVGTTTDAETIYNQSVSIPKNGYIYVYVSNQSPINVYFDNLQVVQTRGPLLEEAHYYPSGLLMAGISDRAWNKLPNYFHYQGKEIQNQEWNDGSGLEEYDFDARFYDQQLGRWNTQDPAGQYSSSYLAMGNNWENNIDQNGKKANFWGSVGAWLSLGPAGYIGASIESGGHFDAGNWNSGWWKGAITGDLISGAALVGAIAVAPAIVGVSASTLASSAAFSVAGGAAIGIAQNVGTTLVVDQMNPNLSQDQRFDKIFQASVTGAISGAFQSNALQHFFDGTGVMSGWLNFTGWKVPDILQGTTSNAIGAILSTGVSDYLSYGANGGWKGINADVLTGALSAVIGQIGHQGSTDNFDDKYQTEHASKVALNVNMASAMLQLLSLPSTYKDDSFYQGLGKSFLPNTLGGWASDYWFPDDYNK